MKTENTKQKAYKYYCKGLNSKEIAKLLDISYRTVQNYMCADEWKAKREPIPLSKKVTELRKKGFTYKRIAKAMGISRSTVYKYLKENK